MLHAARMSAFSGHPKPPSLELLRILIAGRAALKASGFAKALVRNHQHDVFNFNALIFVPFDVLFFNIEVVRF